jgi:hypothetical protein
MNRIIQAITKTTLLDLKTLISHTSDPNLLVLKELLQIAQELIGEQPQSLTSIFSFI